MHSFNNNKTLLLLNPKAGTRSLSSLERQLGKLRNKFDYITLSEIEDLSSFIKSKINSYEIFIAVGGDGTVNSLASNLIDTDRILGVLPFGSGNGFAREMGFKRNIRSLIKDIERKESFGIDVLRINNSTCVNVAGIGIDSLVAHSFNMLRRRGLWNYGITILKTMGKLKPFYAAVRINDKLIEDQFYMVSVANTRQFGNNALLAPMAIPYDGKFNLVLLKPFPKILLPGFVFKLLTGTLKESKYVRYMESGNQVTINSEESRVQIDGEPVIFENAISVTIKRNALRVLKSVYNKSHPNNN
jgi:YegS/Rv2252/BmrU family lipid kinase